MDAEEKQESMPDENFGNFICNDVLTKNSVIDHSKETKLEWFDIPPQVGCWGPKVIFPENWRRWRSQSATDNQTGWVAFLFGDTLVDREKTTVMENSHGVRDEFRYQGSITLRVIKVPD